LEKKIIYDFSQSAEREGTNAEKYTLRKTLFKTEDVEPVWVADMDIDTPSFILEAVKERLKHPIIGYEEVPKSVFKAQCDWMRKKYDFFMKTEDLFYSHSVVASMACAIEAFTNKGDGVIVQTPVYPPFFHTVVNLERKVVKNSLIVQDEGKYSFDIEDLRKKIDSNTKLLLLCSPHNPVGRVWKRDELHQILSICLENNILVFADEIHSDLIYKPHKHIPFASLTEEAKDITITAIGTGKSFNMAGFAMSSVLIQNEKLKQKFQKAYDRVHFAQGSVLSHVAFEAAYNNGEEWMSQLNIHLYKNYEALKQLCDKYSEFIKITPIEATYLAWLDCRGIADTNKKIETFFIYEAKLGLNRGISFGKEGSGYMRLNFAVSSAKMLGIIKKLENALQARRKIIDKN